MPSTPIIAGWTGGAGRRQMENQMEKMPELGLNSRTSGPDPRTQLLNQHSHTHTHIHTHTHTEDLWKANEVITYAE